MNPDPRCRVRSVRYKNSPHLLQIIPKKRTDWREIAHKYLDTIFDGYDGELAIFALYGIGFDGYWNSACKVHPDAPIGCTLLPSAIADIQRRCNMEDIAHDVFNGKL